jgi:uncharacterized protein HemX
VRDSSDCRYIAAAVITNEQTTLALLFGLLAGAYLNHPWCDDAPQPTSKSQILDAESAWRTWIWNSLRREAAKR